MSEREEKQKKFKASPKLWFYIGGLGGLLLFIAVSAWWDLTFGDFDAKDFLADALILVAICLATMVLSDLLSEEANMNKIIGRYNMACNEYMDAVASVEAIKVYFAQWYFVYLESETLRKRENFLVLHGIKGTDARKIVRFATLADVEDMFRSNRDNPFIKTLEDGKKVVMPIIESEEQKQAVISVLNGHQDVKHSNYTDYLFIESVDEANMSTLERQWYLEKRRRDNKVKAYIMRVLTLLFTSFLFAALVPADEEEVGDKKKWWTFMKRLGVFITSFISGWLAGANDVVARAEKIKDKASMFIEFRSWYENNLWKPKTEEEIDNEIIRRFEEAQTAEPVAVEGEGNA